MWDLAGKLRAGLGSRCCVVVIMLSRPGRLPPHFMELHLLVHLEPRVGWTDRAASEANMKPIIYITKYEE